MTAEAEAGGSEWRFADRTIGYFYWPVNDLLTFL